MSYSKKQRKQIIDNLFFKIERLITKCQELECDYINLYKVPGRDLYYVAYIRNNCLYLNTRDCIQLYYTAIIDHGIQYDVPINYKDINILWLKNELKHLECIKFVPKYSTTFVYELFDQ